MCGPRRAQADRNGFHTLQRSHQPGKPPEGSLRFRRSFSRIRRRVTSRDRFTSGGIGVTGRSSPAPMATLRKLFPGWTGPGLVPLPSACSCRSAIWRWPGASSRTGDQASPRRGSCCVFMTPTRTLLGSGGNGSASFRTDPWPGRCPRPMSYLPGRTRGSPDG